MAIETLYADANGTGNVSTPANAVGSTSGTWTTDTGNKSWTHEWPLANPTGTPDGSGHTVAAFVRKENGQSGTPSVVLVLRQGGTTLATSGSTNVTSGTGQLVTFNPGTISITDSTDLRIEIQASAAGGAPRARSSVQVDYLYVDLSTQAVSTVGNSFNTSWDVLSTVSNSFNTSWDIASNAETIYATSMGGHSGGLTTLDGSANVFGAADDTTSTLTDRAWFAVFNMGTPTATIMPETATLNIRAVQSSGTPRYWAWLYEGNAEVEQIVGAQVISGTLTTYQHTINLGKIKDPSQIQIRIDSELASGVVQLDAVWIDLVPPVNKVVASFDTSWDIEDTAGTVASWDFYYPDTTPEPTAIGPGWTVSNWSVGAGGLNADLALSGTDADAVYRNYFTGGAEPNTAYSTEPVLRMGSTASSASDAVTNNKYFEMTFSRTDNGAFTPDAITFRAARGGPAGPRGVILRSDADSFTADLGTLGDIPTERPTWTDYNVDLTGIGEVTTLTLRFYVYTTGATTATIEMDDFVLTGTPSATTSTVSNSFNTSWDIEQTVEASFNTSWDVAETVEASFNTSWDVLTTVSNSFNTSWDVDSDIESVGTWDGTSLTPASTGAGWTVSNLTNDGSLFGPIQANDNPTPNYATQPVYRWISNNTTEVDAKTNDQFWSFTISRSDSGAFTPETFSLDIAKGGSFGTRGFGVYTNDDSYATTHFSTDLSSVRPDWTHYDIDLSSVGEVTSLTVRVYSWVPSTGSTIEADNLEITATPSATGHDIAGAMVLPAVQADATANSDPNYELTGTPTLAPVTSDGTLSTTPPNFDATASMVLPAVQADATATSDPNYDLTASMTLAPVESSGTLAKTDPGFDLSGAMVLPAVQADGTANSDPNYELTASSTLAPVEISGTLSTIPPNFDLVADGTLAPVTASGTLSAGPPTFDITGTAVLNGVQADGTLDTTPPNFDITATGTLAPVQMDATMARTLPGADIVGTLALGPVQADGSLETTPPTFDITGDATLGAISASGQLTKTNPGYDLAGAAVLGAVSASGNIESTAPGFDITATSTLAPAQLSGTFVKTNPGYDLAGVPVLAPVQADGTFETTLPTYDLTAAPVLAPVQASGTASTTPPNFDINVASTLAPVVADGTFTKTNPGYDLAGALELPAVSSEGLFDVSYAFDITGSATLVSVNVTATIETVAPVFDLVGNLVLPAVDMHSSDSNTPYGVFVSQHTFTHADAPKSVTFVRGNGSHNFRSKTVPASYTFIMEENK